MSKAASETADPFLAKPSSECCLKGTFHTGEPRGSFVTIANVETYISRPEEGKENGNIVLYFADIWGMFTNGRLLMDSYAGAGYLVLGLDYFLGDSIAAYMGKNHSFVEGFDFEAWKTKHVEFAVEAVPKWVNEVKSQYGKSETKYACVGYCFGAPYVMNELAGDIVTAGAFAHPAFLKESHFQNIKKPLLLSCAEIDPAFDAASRRKAVDILESEKKPYQLQLFSGVAHGFALRGDITDPYERYAQEQSLKGVISWFDYWLSK